MVRRTLARSVWGAMVAVLATMTVGAVLSLAGTEPADAQATCPSPTSGPFDAPYIDSFPATVTGCNFDLTVDNNPPTPANCLNGGGSADNAVWWRVSLDRTTSITIDTIGSDFDTVLSVWTDNGSLTVVDCNDDAGTTRSQVEFEAQSITTYYVAVQGYGANTGQITLNVRPDCGATTDNDYFDCADVLGTSVPQSGTKNLSGFTLESNEPDPTCEDVSAYNSAWWTWTPTTSARVAIGVPDASDHTSVSVYTGASIDALTEVACSFGRRGFSGDLIAPESVLSAQADTTYLIRVGDDDFGSGDRTLEIRAVCSVAPANDYQECAQALTAGTMTSGTLDGAGSESGEPSCGPSDRSIWYEFTPATAGALFASTEGSSYEHHLGIYTRAQNGSLTEVACTNQNRQGFTNDFAEVVFPGAANTTYYLRISSEFEIDTKLLVNGLCAVSPTNDYFGCATALGPGLPSSDTKPILNSTVQANEPSPSCDSLSSSTGTSWWTFTPTQTKAVRVDLAGDGRFAVRAMDVATGAGVNSLSNVTCERYESGPPSVVFEAVAGTTYRIRTVQDNNESDDLTVTISDLCASAPANGYNDYPQCADVIPALSLPIEVQNVPSTGLVYDPDEPSPPCGGKYDSMWFSWTPTSSEAVVISNLNGNDVLSVWTGSTTAPSSIACDYGAGTGDPSEVMINAVAGTRYLIRVDVIGSNPITVAIDSLCDSAPQPNDLFGCAEPITGSLPLTVTGSNSGAEREPDENLPTCRSNTGRSVWWTWTPTVTETATIDTNGSGFDTVLAVGTGTSVDALTEVACDDDGGEVLQSQVEFPVIAGTKYYIQVSGFNSASGSIELNLAGENDPPVANDDTFEVQRGVTRRLAVMDNDVDDGVSEIVAVTGVVPARAGAVTLRSDDISVDFAAASDFLGEAEFTYTIEDEYGLRSTATVTVDVTGAPILCDGKPVTIFWSPGSVATNGADVILGTEGDDRIFSLGGNDTICALGGRDLVRGDEGNDRIFGGDGVDQLVGAAGDDVIFGGLGIDKIFGFAGDDVLHGDGGSDRIRGGDGNDTVFAGSGADRVWGGDGNDVLNGMGGQDTMLGEAGNDTMQGNFQTDRLYGGPGNDVIRASGGKDLLYGEGGNDELYGGDNTDFLHGGPGVDLADGQRGKDNPLVIDVSGCIAETRISC